MHELREVIPVILAGGEGSRLWPLSHKNRPKPFLKAAPLFGGDRHRSLLQQTAGRFPLAQPPVLIGNKNNAGLLQVHLRACHVTPQQIFLEPCQRGTAPAIAVAAHYYTATGKDPLFLVMPSDHRIARPEALHEAVAAGTAFARAGYLVTFGVMPDRAATGYGYIQKGADLAAGIYDIGQFVEKPDKTKARDFIHREQGWFWNSGIFLFSASAYLDRLRFHAAAVHDASYEAVRRAARRQNAVLLDEASFLACPPASFDRAVMEKDGMRAVIPVDMGWRDLGGWRSFAGSRLGV